MKVVLMHDSILLINFSVNHSLFDVQNLINDKM